MTLRVAVVDDHPVFRLGMVALLDSLPGVRVVAQADGAVAAREVLLREPGAEVVLMDLDLGDGSGVDVTRDVVRARPDLRVLVVTMHEDEDAVVASVRAGARGYLLKSAAPDAVERAVRAVAAGEMILSPAVAERAMSYVLAGRTSTRLPFPQLTDREREVLDLVARGLDNVAVARRLGVTPKTVRNAVGSVLAKLAVSDRAAAVVRARAEGLGT
ncbi:response regulator [Cellulomonas telluris]|uniref:response regulator n=1 Tax=Cellulomonas telluris TaxID=2306636 RepID=UPI0010A77FA7|nr:response regulator transcription factor [Cellulomonas telluris]